MKTVTLTARQFGGERPCKKITDFSYQSGFRKESENFMYYTFDRVQIVSGSFSASELIKAEIHMLYNKKVYKTYEFEGILVGERNNSLKFLVPDLSKFHIDFKSE